MKLFRFLLQSGWRNILLVTAVGVMSGLASSSIVVILNSAVHGADRRRYLFLFLAILVVRVSSNLLAQLLVVRFAQRSIVELTDRIARRVLETPFRALERLGPARILTTLTDDVFILSTSLQSIPAVITNGAILLGCLAYLGILSWRASLTLAVFGLVGGVSYRFLMKRALKAIVAARAERDVLFRHFRVLTDGIKELKMNRSRRNAVLEQDILGSANRLRHLNLAATYQYLLGDGWAQVMFFGIVGVMLFALPAMQDVRIEALTGYLFVALFAMTPIWGLIGAIPIFQRGHAAYQRIETLGLSLAEVPEVAGTPVSPRDSAPAVEFRGVRFAYEAPPGGESGFVLGPIDLTLESGELAFLIGGNGSGKSTLVKLLTGLYAPDEGALLLNGEVVDERTRESYREQFSVVFSDFYLFERMAGGPDHSLDDRARQYLRLLELDRKVTIEGGMLSTTALSQGQRRRLALLSAYLEDRPFYVFDEWAADQDPVYREIFYAKLLPDLKSRGKTVIVITHDDRYFHLGDRVVKLDYGRIVDGWRSPEANAAHQLDGGVTTSRPS